LTFERRRDHIIEEKQIKKKGLKVMRRLMNGALVLTFERWRDHIIQTDRQTDRQRGTDRQTDRAWVRAKV